MFDPPEYVHWNPSPQLDKEYDATIARDEARSKIIAELTQEQLLGMYAGMLRFRLHDITLKRWVKQGILSKAWLGTGEEASITFSSSAVCMWLWRRVSYSRFFGSRPFRAERVTCCSSLESSSSF